jgi:hypothetical protein
MSYLKSGFFNHSGGSILAHLFSRSIGAASGGGAPGIGRQLLVLLARPLTVDVMIPSTHASSQFQHPVWYGARPYDPDVVANEIRRERSAGVVGQPVVAASAPSSPHEQLLHPIYSPEVPLYRLHVFGRLRPSPLDPGEDLDVVGFDARAPAVWRRSLPDSSWREGHCCMSAPRFCPERRVDDAPACYGGNDDGGGDGSGSGGAGSRCPDAACDCRRQLLAAALRNGEVWWYTPRWRPVAGARAGEGGGAGGAGAGSTGTSASPVVRLFPRFRFRASELSEVIGGRVNGQITELAS